MSCTDGPRPRRDPTAARGSRRSSCWSTRSPGSTRSSGARSTASGRCSCCSRVRELWQGPAGAGRDPRRRGGAGEAAAGDPRAHRRVRRHPAGAVAGRWLRRRAGARADGLRLGASHPSAAPHPHHRRRGVRDGGRAVRAVRADGGRADGARRRSSSRPLLRLVFSTAATYPYLTVNAYNLWALFPLNGESTATAGGGCGSRTPPIPDATRGRRSGRSRRRSSAGCCSGARCVVVVPALVARRPDRLTILVGVSRARARLLRRPDPRPRAIPVPVLRRSRRSCSRSRGDGAVGVPARVARDVPEHVRRPHDDLRQNPNVSDWLGIGEAIRSYWGVAFVAVLHTAVFLFAIVQLRPRARRTLAEELEWGRLEPPAADDAVEAPEPDRTGAANPASRWRRPTRRPGQHGDVRSGAAARSTAPSPPARRPSPRRRRSPCRGCRRSRRRDRAALVPRRIPAWFERPGWLELGPIGWLRSRIGRDADPPRPVSACLNRERGGRLDRLDLWILVVLVIAGMGFRDVPAGRARPDALRRGLPRPDRDRVPAGLALRHRPRRSTSGRTRTSPSTRWPAGSRRSPAGTSPSSSQVTTAGPGRGDGAAPRRRPGRRRGPATGCGSRPATASMASTSTPARSIGTLERARRDAPSRSTPTRSSSTSARTRASCGCWTRRSPTSCDTGADGVDTPILEATQVATLDGAIGRLAVFDDGTSVAARLGADTVAVVDPGDRRGARQRPGRGPGRDDRGGHAAMPSSPRRASSRTRRPRRRCWPRCSAATRRASSSSSASDPDRVGPRRRGRRHDPRGPRGGDHGRADRRASTIEPVGQLAVAGAEGVTVPRRPRAASRRTVAVPGGTTSRRARQRRRRRQRSSMPRRPGEDGTPVVARIFVTGDDAKDGPNLDEHVPAARPRRADRVRRGGGARRGARRHGRTATEPTVYVVEPHGDRQRVRRPPAAVRRRPPSALDHNPDCPSSTAAARSSRSAPSGEAAAMDVGSLPLLVAAAGRHPRRAHRRRSCSCSRGCCSRAARSRLLVGLFVAARRDVLRPEPDRDERRLHRVLHPRGVPAVRVAVARAASAATRWFWVAGARDRRAAGPRARLEVGRGLRDRRPRDPGPDADRPWAGSS